MYEYTIKNTFRLQDFLTALRADGIKLYATDEDRVVNGYINVKDTLLSVVLYEASDPDHNIVRLAGSLENYKTQIDLRVAQYAA